MIKFINNRLFLEGPNGTIPVKENDEITLKIAMIYEGECEENGRTKTAEKFGYSRQRYYQIKNQFFDNGSKGLVKQKTGPKENYVRTEEVTRQIIRYRFLDPKVSADVITQRLIQSGHKISKRSVERVVTEYGLQKKTSISNNDRKNQR